MNTEKVDPMKYDENDIAIVGMAIRFPGASSLDEYWTNLRDGRRSISTFAQEELEDLPLSEEFLNQPNVVRAGGILEDVDRFDAPFFGFSRREAEITDPQHRLLLETCWHAMEDTGHDPDRFEGLIGVFAGASASTYLFENLSSNPEIMRTVGRPRVLMGNTANFLSTWLSYKLNLRGPSVTVQTACSTGLVAVHLGWQSLLNGECDMALAGASSVAVPQKSCYVYREGGIQSPDGHCRAFDARAQGTVGGNGVGVVALRRLTDAVEDGNKIHAVIKGSAINNDGSLKVGYTAPSVEGQAAVVAEALAIAGCHPETIQYIEAHGTGTPLGDPIEITALTQVFRSKTRETGFCAIGSVKPSIGHLDTAAGIAGLVKAVLALENRAIPPSLDFEEPNPECRFDESPFRVNDRLTEWPARGRPRRAGVSSLGIGGTNAHVILEEAPRELPPPGPSRPLQLLCLSARTAEALEDAREELPGALSRLPEEALPDVAYTLHLGRKSLPHKLALVCHGSRDALEGLRGDSGRRGRTGHEETRSRGVLFMFPGQGTLRPASGTELYRSEEPYRAAVDRCCELLGPTLGPHLHGLLWSDDPPGDATDELARTSIRQPGLFVFEYALARLWEAWGVRPTAVVGHSLGEYVAACLAGVFSLDTALQLLARRGSLMEELPAGAMLAVPLSEEDARSRLEGDLDLAAVNGDQRVVVSGSPPAIADLEARLTKAGVAAQRLDTDRAFHSPLVEPSLEPFREALAEVPLREPRLPVLSNVTGTWLRAQEAVDPGYWIRHMREPVRFGDALATVLSPGDQVLIEVGPGRGLSSLARRHRDLREGDAVVSSLPGAGDGGALGELLDAAGDAWSKGLPIDWSAFYEGQRRNRIALPGYPFQRESYWVQYRSPRQVERVAVGAAGGEAHEAGAPPTASEAPSAARESGGVGRRERILRGLREIVRDLTGADPRQIDPTTTFFELGVDSLLLIQASERIEKRFGLAVPFRALFEELASLDALADYLDRELPAGELEGPEEAVASVPQDGEAAGDTGGDGAGPGSASTGASEPPEGSLERLMARQLEAQQQLFAQQLAALRGEPAGTVSPRASGPRLPAPAAEGADGSRPEPSSASGEIGPYRPAEAGDRSELDPRQRRHLEELTAAYTRRTARSRELTERYRPVLADNRASVGFRHVWKELTYPIVARRSAGSRIWDVDGNEYVDVTMGFGVNLLGHSPEIVRRALSDQLDRGIQIGPQSDMAGEVAERLCTMTGLERAVFTNSGTEAVMTALRLARAVTGRRKVAMFQGSYHGFYDGTLGRTFDPARPDRVLPVAPGITDAMVEDLLVFEYGTERSLELLDRHADSLAAILVEPVQSRRPSFQPQEFLRRLRALADAHGAALVFDEMVTGFRCHPGGAQAAFGVPADLATYGKTIGGGMPIGVVAGRAELMDAVDGGHWRFGDDSFPSAQQTFFAGTFCKHPLAMSAARAVLQHLEERGPSLQEGLSRKTETLAARLNRWFEGEDLPLRVDHFSSLFRLRTTRPWPYADLLRFHLVHRGVYAWEGATRFLSTAHTESDVDEVAERIQESVDALREGGFLPAGGRSSRVEAQSPGAPAPEAGEPRKLPLTEPQWQTWIKCQMGPEASRAYNQSMTLLLEGPLDEAELSGTVQDLVARHEVLRTTFGSDEPYQVVHPELRFDLATLDLTRLSPARQDGVAETVVGRVVRAAFDMTRGPLLRAALLRLAERRHLLVLVLHHIITDGQSFGVMMRELATLYGRRVGLPLDAPPEAPSYAEFVESYDVPEEDLAAAEAYWLEKFQGGMTYLELPTDRPRPRVQSFDARRHVRQLDLDLQDALKRLGAGDGATLFTVLLAGFKVLLHRLTGETAIPVTVSATRSLPGDREAPIGFRLNPIVLQTDVAGHMTFREVLQEVKSTVLEGYQHQDYPFHRLLERLGGRRDPARNPQGAVAFNLDRAAPPQRIGELTMTAEANVSGATVDLYLGITDAPDGLHLVCDYNSYLFGEERVADWMAHLEALFRGAVEGPARPVDELPGPEAATVSARERGVGPASNLSRYQQLLWAGQRIQPDLPIYVACSHVQIPMKIDASAFQEAFRAVVAGSDELRLTIQEVDDVPVRRTRPELPVTVGLVDLTRLSEPDAEVERLTSREVRRPFDLEERLFHTFLTRTGPSEHSWFFNQHHLGADGFSNHLVWEHVAQAYERIVAGEPTPELDIPSCDEFIRSEARYLESPEAREDEAFWKARLDRPAEDFRPFGRSPSRGSTRTVREYFELGPERMERLRAFLERPDVFVKTSSISALNVFASLLSVVVAQLSATPVVSLGVPFKNRPEGFEASLGSFMHILPVRLPVRTGDSFVSLVREVAGELREAYRHQRFPVANTLEDRAYEVEFNFTNFQYRELLDTRVQRRYVHSGHYNEPLVFEVQEFSTDREPVLYFDFNEDLFGAGGRRRVIELFLHVMDVLLDDPESPIGTLELRPAAARHMLREVNDTAAGLPASTPMFELFETQAEQTPDRLAVSCGETSLTYAQLLREARSLSAALLREGLEPGDVVALFMDRSPRFLVSMLGVFGARGAYVPCDPSHPLGRTGGMLRSAGARLVLVDGGSADRAAGLSEHDPGAPWRSLRVEDLVAGSHASPALPKADYRDLAYVLFTSGSTGIPKGAMIEQRGMVNHLFANIRALELGPEDVILQNASQCFDVSVWQFLVALVLGGRVAIASNEALQDPERLVQEVEASGATVLEMVPSLLAAMVDLLSARDGDLPELASLRFLMPTGEALEPDLCERWFELYPDRPLWNAYGPAECSDDVTLERIPGPSPRDVRQIPIGRPVANTAVHFVARDLTPTLPGVPGELCVAGTGVGWGYVAEPARTAEAFVPNPFGGGAGARLYRSGDVARLAPSGTVEFLGRIDHQVKIRGHRIELGEIEAVLTSHEDVSRAAVVKRTSDSRPATLAAYVVPQAGHTVSGEALRRFIEERLPAYMVPASFTRLDRLPLNANGKVDRSALPEPEDQAQRGGEERTLPRDEVEEVLAQEWCRVLGLSEVGVHDDFFQMGGDSILAIQIVSRARRRGLEFTPIELFRHPTIAELAPAVDSRHLQMVEQGRVTGPVPLIPAQRRFFELEPTEREGRSQAMLLELRERLEPAALEVAVDRLLDHHDALRLRFLQSGAVWRQRNAEKEESRVVVTVDLAGLAGPGDPWRSALAGASSELRRRFDLATGPLVRVALFRAPEESPERLVLVVHPLVMDGVSWRILLEDLLVAYRQAALRHPVELPPKTVSFKRFSETLEELAESRREELAYWLRLAETPHAPLPRDFSDGSPGLHLSSTVTVTLDGEETTALLATRDGGPGGRVDAVLLAALAASLGHETLGAEALRVDLESHDRPGGVDGADPSRTVGWLAPVYPLSLPVARFEGELDLPATADAVGRELESVPDEGVGHGVLLYSADGSAAQRLRELPQAEVRFHYLGPLDRVLDETSPFRLGQEALGWNAGARRLPGHLLDVSAAVVDGVLTLHWTFDPGVHRSETVRDWALQHVSAVREILALGPAPHAAPDTLGAGDFDWNEEEIRRIEEALQGQGFEGGSE